MPKDKLVMEMLQVVMLKFGLERIRTGFEPEPNLRFRFRFGQMAKMAEPEPNPRFEREIFEKFQKCLQCNKTLKRH